MSTAHTALAAALLEHVPGPAAAATMLERAQLRSGISTPVGCAPPEPAALAAARGPAAKAVAVASAPNLSPAVLTALAKHSSRQVRRLVAAHPNTPVEVLERLRVWADKNRDQQTLDGLYRTLPLLEFLPVLTFTSDGSWAALGDGVIDQLRDRADNGYTRQVFRLALTARRSVIAFRIFGEAIRGRLSIDPADLLDVLDELAPGDVDDSMRSRLLESGLNAGTTRPYGECVEGHPGWSIRFTEEVLRWLATLPEKDAHDLSFPRCVYGAHASTALLRTGLPKAAHAVLSGDGAGSAALSTEALELVVSHPDQEVRVRALQLHHLRDALTDEQVERVVAELPKQHTGGVSAAVLDDPNRSLSDRAQAGVIALSSTSHRDAWILGRYHHQASPAALEMLAARPGWSLGRGNATSRPPAAPVPVSRLLDEAAVGAPFHVVDNEPFAALIDLSLPLLLKWVEAALDSGPVTVRTRIASRHLSRRLTERFGDDGHVWAVAVELAHSLGEVSVDEWLDTVAAVTGAVQP